MKASTLSDIMLDYSLVILNSPSRHPPHLAVLGQASVPNVNAPHGVGAVSHTPHTSEVELRELRRSLTSAPAPG